MLKVDETCEQGIEHAKKEELGSDSDCLLNTHVWRGSRGCWIRPAFSIGKKKKKVR